MWIRWWLFYKFFSSGVSLTKNQKIPRSKTITSEFTVTSKKMVRSYYCRNSSFLVMVSMLMIILAFISFHFRSYFMISFSLFVVYMLKIGRWFPRVSQSLTLVQGPLLNPYIEDALYAEVCSECNCTKIMHAHYLSVFYLKHDVIGQDVRHEYAECMNRKWYFVKYTLFYTI